MFNFEYVDEVASNSTKLATTQLLLMDGVTLDYEEYSAHAFTWTVTVSVLITKLHGKLYNNILG